MYTQHQKRQKTYGGRQTPVTDSYEFFPGVTRVEYRPGASAEDSLCFRHYNPSERVHGRTMEEWFRPAVSYWHAFSYQGLDRYGMPAFIRPWDEAPNSLEACKRRVRAAFEFFSKLGVRYWTVFDRDLTPEGYTLEESFQQLDEVIDLVQELQQRTGIKPLWFGCNLFSHPRSYGESHAHQRWYANGAATNPDAHVAAYAAAQCKKAFDIAMKLGAENFLLWGAREGYHNPMVADLPREMRNYAKFLKIVADYKDKHGFRGNLLIRPGPHRESRFYNSEHRYESEDCDTFGRYDYDAMSTLCLLKHHGLERQFKLHVYPGRDHLFASAMGYLGCIEYESYHEEYFGDFRYNGETTVMMKNFIDQGGIQPGGVSLALRPRRESHDFRDLFLMYVQSLDTLAKGLKTAVRLTSEGHFSRHLQQRYSGYQSGIGARLASGEASLEECDEFVKRHGEPNPPSARLEHWNSVFRYYNEH
ncbi:xylose isomerase-like isoform X3 [Cloeon dipterum]|uniref:Xylose isomerase n=1 Tax=Cloeon dipterum TaxID=197152 RepID=A0A8S1BXL7_9INSE|nr:Hypothetical predicted protein [Cloeon dipterum]